jgi:hypothetical protein
MDDQAFAQRTLSPKSLAENLDTMSSSTRTAGAHMGNEPTDC